MGNSIKSFEELKCWQACREVRKYVMEIIKKFPPEKKYALTDGSISSTENIAIPILNGYFNYLIKV